MSATPPCSSPSPPLDSNSPPRSPPPSLPTWLFVWPPGPPSPFYQTKNTARGRGGEPLHPAPLSSLLLSRSFSSVLAVSRSFGRRVRLRGPLLSPRISCPLRPIGPFSGPAPPGTPPPLFPSPRALRLPPHLASCPRPSLSAPPAISPAFSARPPHLLSPRPFLGSTLPSFHDAPPPAPPPPPPPPARFLSPLPPRSTQSITVQGMRRQRDSAVQLVEGGIECAPPSRPRSQLTRRQPRPKPQ